jgi:type VI secretion system protein ImpL
LRETIVTALKYLLHGLAAVLLVLCLFGLTLMMGWPWWVGIFLTLAFVALVIGLWFLKRVLLRRREQNFVQQVIEEDNQKIQALTAAEQGQHKELQLRWKEAIETLRRSHLRKQGNPLYVLPWYLMMGESGSGKSTAINSARLGSPFSGTKATSGISGTRNCDWWFFDESIIIDTAGRYSMPVDPGPDNEEWQKFLSLLVKYRRREPIHGVIMTLPVDKILNCTAETLEHDGLQLRRRLDELMRVLGVTFPVYLLVTKCDLVQGMSEFSARLGEKALNQPMGGVNQELETDVAGFVQGAMRTVAERLKSLRISMLHKPDRAPLPANALLFPDEFAELGAGIERFVRAAFEQNRYQETPLLRGIYFSSGRQEGTPFSHFLNKLGLIGEQEVLPGTSKGLFLHDFFDQVLPSDRRLLAPTSRAKQWQILTRNIGLTSWVVLWIALCGLMTYSFVKNMSTIRTASGVIAKSPELTGEFTSDVATMERYRRMILDVEQKNSKWWVPRFWLKESLDVEKRLKATYCKRFQERFLASFDRNMAEAIGGFTSATPDDLAGQYMVHLTRRINLLERRLDKGEEGIASMPLPTYLLSARPLPEELAQAQKFGEQYANYLLWRGDSGELNGEIGNLQALLKRIVAVKGAGLSWLPEWVNRQGGIAPITLQSFWGGSRSIADETYIAPAFTRKGRGAVAAFQNEFRSAYPDPAVLERDQGNFESWYRGNCYAAWLRFAGSFSKGEERLNGAREWRAVAESMPTDRGPYFAFFDRAASELTAFGGIETMPPLLQQIIQLRLLKEAGVATGAAAKAVEEGKKLTGKVGDLIGKPVSTVPPVSSVEAAKSLTEFRGALTSIVPAAKSRTQAYQMAVQVFSEDPAVSKSPFYVAYNAAERMKGEIAGGSAADPTFSRLASGPVAFLWSYVQKETACAIQTQWEEQVLREAQGARDPQMLQYLVAQEGPVWKFVNGSLGCFQGWAPGKGYYCKIALGGSVPFQPAFFSFMAKGTKAKVAMAARPQAAKQSYPVTVRGLPTDANADAAVKPQSTRLEIQCASGAQTIENLNYPVTKTFSWSPESCGEVTFQVEVGELLLTRQYQGLPAFLKEFAGGRHTFYPRDFPREKAALERLGIRFIRPNYHFSGAADVMAQGGGAGGAGGDAVAGEIPRKITKCWE